MDTLREMWTFCLNYISTIEVWDILDMAIIAFLIYHVIIFIKKTSSVSVVKGIGLLIIVMWLSTLLNLSVLNYLINKAFEIGVLALIILFQPELRRILEQVGSNKFRNIFTSTKDEHAIDYAISQTVIACTDFAKTKTGALIVFERNLNLDAYIKTGSVINAEPASELLKNIFYHNTPLHDGAVIMREGRIIGAACMLPLSNNSNLSRDIGMRHRAAVGMSEHSDAVVAVVSEETGTISVAIGGMLKRHLAPDTFDRLLRNELLPKEDKKKGFRLFRRKKEKAGDK